MFYNTKTNELLNSCPLNGYLTDGSLVQGLDIADFTTRKTCGILPVKSDSPSQPENSYEDVTQRSVVVEDDGVVVNRVYLQNPPEVVSVPESVSARQIRLWLIDNNISLTSVENTINSIVNENLREKTLVEWEFAPYIERDHPLVNTLAESLGLTNEQVDQAFITASNL